MKDNNQESIRRILLRQMYKIVPLLVVVVLLITSGTFYGWFSYERRTTAVKEISNPTAIYISAGHQEDIMYMDLSDLDFTQGNYKDFIFCIRGNNVLNYRIQLAYTTNNQLSFELYNAVATDESDGLVTYITHDSSPEYLYYKIDPERTNALRGAFLNDNFSYTLLESEPPSWDDNYTWYYRYSGGNYVLIDDATAPEFVTNTFYKIKYLANDDDIYYTLTYGNYDYVNEYAIPLYWKNNGNIHVNLDSHNDFCDYYILRVIWGPSRANDKETDILYISAKNIQSN